MACLQSGLQGVRNILVGNGVLRMGEAALWVWGLSMVMAAALAGLGQKVQQSLEFVFFKGGSVGSELHCNSDLTTLFRSAKSHLTLIFQGGVGWVRVALQLRPYHNTSTI